jgi:cell division protein FtsI (penicillin-binding protein 3)
VYEPGSTFKAILAAAALDQGVAKQTDQVFCEEGRYRIGRRTVRDHHPHGWLSLAEVVQYSSNIGTTKFAQSLGNDRFHAYVRAFGFGEKTGIDLPGEVPGMVRPVEGWTPIDLATASFGQGLAVTPLQISHGRLRRSPTAESSCVRSSSAASSPPTAGFSSSRNARSCGGWSSGRRHSR